jgi:hypothetical protein
MNSTKILGMILIGLGIVALAYQGIQYTTREKVLDVGPLHVTKDKTNTVPLTPITGLFAMAGGILLLVVDSRRRRA